MVSSKLKPLNNKILESRTSLILKPYIIKGLFIQIKVFQVVEDYKLTLELINLHKTTLIMNLFFLKIKTKVEDIMFMCLESEKFLNVSKKFGKLKCMLKPLTRQRTLLLGAMLNLEQKVS